MVHCDFCGFEFDPACNIEGGCSGCPLHSSCARVTCPRCGYEMLPEAKLIGWLRKISAGWQNRKPGEKRLTETTLDDLRGLNDDRKNTFFGDPL